MSETAEALTEAAAVAKTHAARAYAASSASSRLAPATIRLRKSDVTHRFVVDMASLRS